MTLPAHAFSFKTKYGNLGCILRGFGHASVAVFFGVLILLGVICPTLLQNRVGVRVAVCQGFQVLDRHAAELGHVRGRGFLLNIVWIALFCRLILIPLEFSLCLTFGEIRLVFGSGIGIAFCRFSELFDPFLAPLIGTLPLLLFLFL